MRLRDNLVSPHGLVETVRGLAVLRTGPPAHAEQVVLQVLMSGIVHLGGILNTKRDAEALAGFKKPGGAGGEQLFPMGTVERAVHGSQIQNLFLVEERLTGVRTGAQQRLDRVCRP